MNEAAKKKEILAKHEAWLASEEMAKEAERLAQNYRLYCCAYPLTAEQLAINSINNKRAAKLKRAATALYIEYCLA